MVSQLGSWHIAEKAATRAVEISIANSFQNRSLSKWIASG
jgi:hypothetical protein